MPTFFTFSSRAMTNGARALLVALASSLGAVWAAFFSVRPLESNSPAIVCFVDAVSAAPSPAGTSVDVAKPHATVVRAVDDPCECKVVNRADVTVPSPDTCDNGQQTVPCFECSQATYPDGMPIPGRCEVQEYCTDGRSCTYRKMLVTVTIAACAGTDACTGYGTTGPVNGKKVWDPAFQHNPGTEDFTHELGASHQYEIDPGSAVPRACNSVPEKDIKLKFLKKDGTTAFEITFKFGCGICGAQQQ